MPSDEELFTAYVRRGDIQSLSALVDRHGRRLTAFLSGMLPKAEVEDAFQETWRRLLSRASAYRGGNFGAYLMTVARHVSVDRLRSRREAVSLDGMTEEGAPFANLADTALQPDRLVERRATGAEVRAAVRSLPEGPRQVVLLRLEGELSFKEIAAELGVPLGTVLSWMHVATIRLREKLGGER